MKKILLCTLACFSVNLLPANENNIINSFINTHIKPLNPDEIQFFANMAYLSYALATIDSHVRDTAQNVLENAWSVRQATLQYIDTTMDLIQLQTAAENLDHGTQTQLTILKSWKLCTALIDQLEQNDPLALAVEIFRKNVEQEVKLWAASHNNEFNTQLHESSIVLNHTVAAINAIANTFNDLKTNNISASQSPDYEDVSKIIAASKAASNIEEQCEIAFNVAARIAQTEIDLQRISADVFFIYYKAIYQVIQELESKYRTLLFDDQGIIPMERRHTLLPNIEA